MRLTALLAFACVCFSAEAEYVTLALADGRSLTGEYDAKAGVLDMGLGKINVAPGAIVSKTAAARPVPKAAPVDDPMGDPVLPADKTARLAALRNLLARAQDQAKAAQAALLKSRDAVASAQADQDLRAVAKGGLERQQAEDKGSAKCREMYPNADANLVAEWRRRFESQARKVQEARQAAAERRAANAVAAEKAAVSAAASAADKVAKLQASLDKLSTP